MERQAAFDPQGQRIPEALVNKAFETTWETFSSAFKYSHDRAADIPASESLLDFVRKKLNDTVPDPNQRQLFQLFAKMWGGFVGGTIEGQSLKFLWLEETLEGENLFCAGTYQKVLQVVSKPALDGAKVVLGKKVTKIRSTPKEDKPRIAVESCDGESQGFDEVVITAPLGWLKRNKAAFEPPMPNRVEEAIDNVGYGNLDKVWHAFPIARAP